MLFYYCYFWNIYYIQGASEEKDGKKKDKVLAYIDHSNVLQSNNLRLGGASDDIILYNNYKRNQNKKKKCGRKKKRKGRKKGGGV